MVEFVMPWSELHIHTHADHANRLSDYLTLHDAKAISFQDAGNQPIYEPKPGDIWQEVIVIGLFEHTLLFEPLLSFLKRQQAAGAVKHFYVKHLEDQDWERICLAAFKPMQFGQRLWICPSWQ